jgi:hypothetical protein
MSKKFVISNAPNAAPRSIGGRSDHSRCFIVCFPWLVKPRAVFWSLAILVCVISADVRGADERLQAAEHRALIAAANAESAYFQRENVQLIAPEVRQQIQDLADQISLAAGTDRRFKVFVLNQQILSTQSSANGDIYLPTGYLDMIEDRDELAFGLAREIGLQIKDLRLKEMKQQLQDARRTKRLNLFLKFAVTSAIESTYGTYALAPVTSAIYRNTHSTELMGIQMVTPVPYSTPIRNRVGLASAPPPSRPQMEGIGGPDFSDLSASQSATRLISGSGNWVPTDGFGNWVPTDGFLNWVPNLINWRVKRSR